MSAQGLGIAPGIDRQKVFEHAGGDPVRHTGGNLRPHLIEFGGRAAMCGPAVPGLRPAAAGVAEAGQSERDLTGSVETLGSSAFCVEGWEWASGVAMSEATYGSTCMNLS